MSKKIDNIVGTQITLYGHIMNMNHLSIIFKYNQDGTEYTMDCVINFPLDEINPNDPVELKGTLSVSTDNKIQCVVTNIKNITQIDSDKNRYNTVISNLNKKSSILDKIKNHKKNVPSMIYNIGFILIDCDQDKISDLKKISGNIRYINIGKNITDNFIRAYNYYSNYRNIDMICVMGNNLSWSEIRNINEVSIINSLKNTDKKVFTSTCFIDCVPHQNILNMYSDKIFNNIDEIVIFVKSKQDEYKTRIINLENMMKDKLNEYDKLMNNELFEIRNKININIDENFDSGKNVISSDKYYDALIKIILDRMIRIIYHKIQKIDSEINTFINEFYRNRITTLKKKFQPGTKIDVPLIPPNNQNVQINQMATIENTNGDDYEEWIE